MKTIKKIFASGEIPICFSANSDFLPYTAVMIQSIIDNSKPSKNYDIIILYSDMEEPLREKLCSMKDGYENIEIRFFDVSKHVENFNFFTGSVYTKSPYSREVYFRLLIPTLMPEYDKVIYLDGDMITLADVSELYDVDISDFLIAACRDYAGIAHCYTEGDDRREYRSEILGSDDVDGYIISGLVIFNVKKFNERYTARELMEFSSSREWRQHDQDVLNALCFGEIHILPGGWNYLFDNSLVKNLPSPLYNEYVSSEQNLKIVHFAGERKPKIEKPTRFSELFWNMSKKTPFYDILCQK